MKHKNPKLFQAVRTDLTRRVRDAVVKARHDQSVRLTQRGLAERIGVSDKVIGNLERSGHLVSLPLFRQLCLALNLDANEVLGLNPRRTYLEEPRQ